MNRTKLYWILGFVGVLLSMTGDLFLGAHVHPDAPDAYTTQHKPCISIGSIGMNMRTKQQIARHREQHPYETQYPIQLRTFHNDTIFGTKLAEK